MKRINELIWAMASAAFCAQAGAATITIDPNQVFQIRSTQTTNSVGLGDGDRLYFGAASVIPSGTATTVTATNPAVSGRLELVHFPSDVSPGEYVYGLPFSAGIASNPWTLTAENGGDTATAQTPAWSSVPRVPFATSFSIVDGTSTTPTFRWTTPGSGSAFQRSFDDIRISIWDRGDRFAFGAARVIKSYFLPAVANELSVGPGVLGNDRNYSVSIRLREFDGSPPIEDRTASRQISTSRAFFDFSTGGALPEDEAVYLPTVDPSGTPEGGPVYEFNVQGINAGEAVFIDPAVAVGYDYSTGDGDPNFAGVQLPDAGDGLFDLLLFGPDGGLIDTEIELVAGNWFDFTSALTPFGIGANGIDRFRIAGIETDARLDPRDGAAFATGLRFTADGAFTGTMTPIVRQVPSPGMPWLMLAGGLAAFVAGRPLRITERH